MGNNFWAIEVHTGKMQKFATVSSEICMMRYVQRTLLLRALVCFCSICAGAGACDQINIQQSNTVLCMVLLQK